MLIAIVFHKFVCNLAQKRHNKSISFHFKLVSDVMLCFQVDEPLTGKDL